MTPHYQRGINTLKDPAKGPSEIKNRIPLSKRMTASEEIAATAVFLLSDRSSHTKGQWLVVDGGYIH